MTSWRLHSLNGKTLGVLMALWAAATAVPLTMLMASHDLPLPDAAVKPVVAAAPSQRAKWQVIHVLADGCPCSAAVTDALLARGANAEADEIAVVEPIGTESNTPSLAARMKAGGFAVESQLPADVANQLEIEGGPWLIVVRPDRQIAYSGGYASTRPRKGTLLSDQTILQRLQRGETVTPFPAYGCVTSRSLQQVIDPLGLKYGS